MRKTKVLLILSIIFLSFSLKAAVPTWSVDPNLYSYNMTITGAINTNYIESTDPNDIIAAFVGGECRGLVHPVYKSEINRYICYLMVYSNVSTQALTFKIYDASEDQVYDVSKTITFAVNGIIGSNQVLKLDDGILSFIICRQLLQICSCILFIFYPFLLFIKKYYFYLPNFVCFVCFENYVFKWECKDCKKKLK